jgi:aspartyl-tRNA(Asn)/glutamyl-tRNA(Gln) amidotransferase subunit B
MLKTIIGLEIHVQLNTKSKMFCGCDNNAESKEPNTVVCPVCMGFPGTLPVANIEAIKKTIKTGLALNCIIPDESKFDRKHYFYPDLPKNFQISQYDMPFARNGSLKLKTENQKLKTVRINRVHLEEDAGKLIHPKGAGYTLVDMNRCSTPLMEIVTEPDINSPELAKIFLKELRLIVRYLSVSDADMEKGHLRCDANISVRNETDSSPIVEIKNMNSFRAVEGALSFEEKRLKEDFEELKKEKGKQTRSWDDEKGETKAMRRKEEASDYRYFPEPDVPPIKVGQGKNEINLEEIKREIPILPEEKRKHYLELGLEPKAAEAIVAKKSYSNYFDKVIKLKGDPHKVYDLMINERAGDSIKPKLLVEALNLVSNGTISNKILKDILPEIKEAKSVKEIIERKGLKQLSDEGYLRKVAEKVIKSNPGPVADYKKGKTAALGFLVGQVMKETKGQANPALTNKLLTEMLR